jgi:penicillin-binding protein 1A
VILVRVLSSDERGAVVALDQEPQVQGALFSIEAQTGQVLAMEGGYDFTQSEFNRAIQASRQPGSAFKPFIYAAALEKGFNPASIIVDSPVVYDDGENGAWKPENFETKFYGDTTFRQALIKSRNVPTIKIVQAISVSFLFDFLQRVGLEGSFSRDLSISLGSGTVSLFDLTRAYALFPRQGRKVEPVFVLSVRDRDGRILEESKTPALDLASQAKAVLAQASAGASGSAVQDEGAAGPPPLAQLPTPEDPSLVVDPRAAYVMTHLMKEVVAYGTGHEAKRLQRPTAGKTGTTNDNIDAWFMGFTPHIVTGAWVGFDSQRPIGPSETGARAALPIWLEFMMAAVKKYPDTDFQVPAGIVFAPIDPVSGKLVAANSSRAMREAFVEGTEPREQASDAGGGVGSASDFLKEDSE